MTSPKLSVLWHWQTMGPYHFARMRALAQVPGIDLTVVESAGVDDHGWTRPEEQKDIALLTLSSEVYSKRILKVTKPALARILNERRPDVVVGPGYAEPHSLRAMLTYKSLNPTGLTLLWSESTAMDHPRSRLKERIKSLFLSVFDGALAAGRPHASYLESLGMPAAQIRVVGNCVDNEFFSSRVDALRRDEKAKLSSGRPQNFFLFVGRMLPEKNVSGLIEAYRRYRRRDVSAALELVLVGTGPEEASLRKRVNEAGVPGVRFAGLRQPHELPEFYALARCLILPSVSEPWGLVVNEAMASGIPVLASNRCGCVPDLLREGVNGFVFDPGDHNCLANLLVKLSDGTVSPEALGAQGRRMIAEYTPARFGRQAAEHFRFLHECKARPSLLHRTRHPLTQVARPGVGFLARLWEQIS